MTTITRDDLRKMASESVIRKNEEKIKHYVNTIKEKIIKMNENGDKKYFFNFDEKDKSESQTIFKEVVTQLQNIFVDMDIMFRKSDGYYADTHIEFDWT